MTSPPKQITIDCPACGREFRDWYRPSVNLDLEDLDETELQEATTAQCPHCDGIVDLDALIVDSNILEEASIDTLAVAEAMETLRVAERDRLEAILKLKQLGAIRSRSVVGEVGEVMAAAYYGVPRAPKSTPGYDLVRPDGKKVQVKTLRSTPGNFRTTIGMLEPDYDLLLAIRLTADYEPEEVIEVPKRIVEQHFANGGVVTWTRRLAGDPGTLVIPPEAFRFPG